MLMDTNEFFYLYGTLYGTVVVFGVITFLVYYCLLRPFFAARPDATAAALGGPPRSAPAPGALGDRRGVGASSSSSSGKDLKSAPRRRLPPHVLPASVQQQQQQQHPLGSISLADGLVSFRQTRASRQADRLTAKERAGILSDLLLASATATAGAAGGGDALPSKGGTWIMSVPVSDETLRDEARWERLRPVLAALGTHYNLLVVLAVAEAGAPAAAAAAATATATAKRLRDEWIAQLRRQPDAKEDGSTPRTGSQRASGPAAATSVSADVLPTHRIVSATTVAGRVAFVRQVQRVGLVVDFDPAVHEQLSRFGHKVMVYDYYKL